MDLSRLTRRAKELVDKRGGTESLKEDAEELRDIARRKGSTSDKAREAFDAIREPGAPGGPPAEPGAGRPPAEPRTPPAEPGGGV
jgi:hypothetical protein